MIHDWHDWNEDIIYRMYQHIGKEHVFVPIFGTDGKKEKLNVVYFLLETILFERRKGIT